MNCTTSSVAPLGAQPVAVFTNAAPARMHTSQAFFSWSRLRWWTSRMTLTGISPAACTTARMSSSQ